MGLKLDTAVWGGRFLRWIFALLLIAQILTPSAYGQLMIHGDGGGGSGSCMVKSGAFPVGFAAYHVEERGKNANVMVETVGSPQAFCDHLPKVGRFSMTVDIHDDALRVVPIAMRLVRKGDVAEEGVASWPARIYPNGTVRVEVELTRPGRYSLLLNVDKGAPSPIADVRIPLQVGDSETPAYLLVVVGMVLLLGAAGYLWKRKKQG